MRATPTQLPTEGKRLVLLVTRPKYRGGGLGGAGPGLSQRGHETEGPVVAQEDEQRNPLSAPLP